MAAKAASAAAGPEGTSTSGDEGERLVWIDCDAGIDDAQALLLALSLPRVKLVAVSCVHGNADVRRVATNVARVLALCGAAGVPIYLGAEEPLVAAHSPYDREFHGDDGLGGVPDIEPAAAAAGLQAPEKGATACGALLRAAEAHAGRLHLIALGPLTNVALACQLDPGLPQRLASFTVMGAAEAVGNVTPTAEFNVYADPEAAHMALAKFPLTTLVTWEASNRHALPWEWVEDQWLARRTPKSRFLASVMAFGLDKWRTMFPAGWSACDALAVAVALRPDIVRGTKEVFVDVELRGSLTRGMTVFDWHGVLRRAPNARLVAAVDEAAYRAMLLAALD
ncbi:MAG: Inosine/uridine-preferring nucleoside hydrolase domain-containing protein [Monoraphidium minutum]|nr:MAG: Inosine/uridine-preferring nucleoside hydrolase domain-containing protein [Monoraphidium minutum]